jgi:hypothetical protein
MPEGRGRLSSIDLVPEEAQDDILWALGELNKRKRSQADILFELNDRLAVHGIEPISKSAFNRKAIRLAAATRRLDESRHIFAGLADQFTPEKVDASNLVLGEVLKMLVYELTEEGAEGRSPKEAMELARAYLATIQGQKISTERRRTLEVEFKAKAEKAVEAVAKAKGLTADTVDAIKERILGIRAEKPAEGAS